MVWVVKGNPEDRLIGFGPEAAGVARRRPAAGEWWKAAEGPERVEPEWWRDCSDRPARDYWRVELASGARLWVCRVAPAAPGEGERWVLHGLFA